ncbi:G patch domain-containing protein 11-like isoform X2 [Salvia splendens]|uniref:G patch domain-containing protein 11-like isoform X2 n=1 Tax=Salvia splendens TaxID=180675 RepID=UPI001C2699E3|nr:G patch domain-containing protein 11-like isoform X2 [Salvia splendens]
MIVSRRWRLRWRLNEKLMAEEDDDYMGDLSQFVPPEVSQSSKKVPSSNNAIMSKSSSSKKSKYHNWQEQRKLDRNRKQVEEDKLTLENAGSAIPQSNIGFKLLKQMGYSPGSALGKEGSGRAEPVSLEIRRGRAGIGTEDPEVAKMRRERAKYEMDKRKESELMEVFGSHQKERWKGRRVVMNFQKADAALAQLENREVKVEKNEEVDTEKEGEEEEEEEITEEDLLNVLLKLRNEFKYCLFCGCQYESMEALESNCPGINEDDH